jgi:hypothetical protein
MLSIHFSTRVLYFLLFCFPVICIQAQTVEQVKQSRDYYWGEGTGKTVSLADEEALSMLIGSISTNVESKFSMRTEEVSHNNISDFKQYVNSLVKTYSNATIKNTEILSWGEEPQVHVFRFVKKAEVHKIFAEREQKIKEFIEIALRAESKYQIADALRYYYWALMLLQSHPDAGSMTMQLAGKEQKLDVYLPIQINAIFDNLDFFVSGKQFDDNITQYLFRVTYKKEETVNCDYSFFDGRNWSLVIGAQNGKGIAELAGDTSSHRDIRIKIEYAFENEWKIDNEVNDVLRKVDPVIFKKSYRNISLAKVAIAEAVKVAKTVGSDRIVEDDGTTIVKENVGNSEVIPTASIPPTIETIDGTPYLPMLQRVENSIRTKNYESVRDCFTADGYDIFTQLVQYGRALIISQPVYSFLKFEDGILARSLSMRFSFLNNRRVFVEDVVFTISQNEGKIQSLSFALPNKVCSEILRYEQWGEYSRVAIINFIENYKTAYALKRLDYIESIFSDNALIIVGKIMKNYEGTDNLRTLTMPHRVKLTQYSKEQYMKQLATVFKSNEYVNLKFTDISVKKAGKGGEIYGIQLMQDYFSTSYGDQGYLFLMVDLNKTDEPIIHIRTWQPEKDPDFGLYDITNF